MLGRQRHWPVGERHHTDSSTPVVVSGLTSAVAISAGGSHSCAVLANGTAKCWGYNDLASWGTAPDRLVDAGRRQRLDHRRRDHRRRLPFVCVVGERHRQMLGLERRWPVGERHHHRLVDAGSRQRHLASST